MDYKKLLNLSMKIGSQLLINGAETYRVEESIKRILTAYGVEKVDVFAITSYISITITPTGDDFLTITKRLYSRGLNLQAIHNLNCLCRKLCCQTPELDVAEQEYNELSKIKDYSPFIKFISFGIVSASFCLFYGGNIFDSIISFFCGLAAKLIVDFTDKFHSNTFFVNILGSIAIAIVAILGTHFALANNTDKIITGALMTLVPGVLLTNSMRDIIGGDLIAGVLKLTEAFLVATAIALGVGITIMLYRGIVS